MNLRQNISFGFEQTFTINEWWNEPGFCNVSDTPEKRKYMKLLADKLAQILTGEVIESKDIWDHMQYEVVVNNQTQFYVTMDPGSIEVKTIPKLIDDIESYIKPLHEAANLVGLVPYRNWWYGIQKGTEGGCHINMGGMNPQTNPFIDDPDLLVKYCAYIHNRPFLSYPFMGLDVGPGGNAQRMDEKEGFKELKKLFSKYKMGSFKTLDDVYNYFEQSNLINDKSSFPSLKKIQSPLNLIEDRAQEALRFENEYFLVCDLKLKILEYLQTQDKIEKLETFENIHSDYLTSFFLWNEFQHWANEIGLNPVFYQCFFDRQFPKLYMGENPPTKFTLKEGRRPRKVLEVYKRDDGTVTGKKVDTNFKRFELYYMTQMEEQFDFEITYKNLEFKSETLRHNGYLGFGEQGVPYYCYFDIELNPDQSVISIKLIDKLTGEVIESTLFDAKSMFFA
ncbi:MAG: transglutaminase family protein [Bacteriovoracaceae bacterium]|jgi:hypothetical protein|nr:transglutaminase family protein [Bacteriovoracaceae bacterium]